MDIGVIWKHFRQAITDGFMADFLYSRTGLLPVGFSDDGTVEPYTNGFILLDIRFLIVIQSVKY